MKSLRRVNPMISLVSAFTAFVSCGAAGCIGLVLGTARKWPEPLLHHLYTSFDHGGMQTDLFGRLVHYPGKIAIPCPAQDATTAVFLVIGQSNAGNYQGQRHASADDRVINYANGHCYRSASPILGADGTLGETWTLLGQKLVAEGLYHTVILVPAAVGGSPIKRWVQGADLNTMMLGVIGDATQHYTFTAILWDQGAEDAARHTPYDRYRADTVSLIDTIRSAHVNAPFYITRCSAWGDQYAPDNPISRAQASLADGRTVFDGPNTDRDVSLVDRYDGAHFGATGQEKYASAWVDILRQRADVMKRAGP